MSLNLYDLLDVDESASSEEIRAAWKAAIGDLDPTDRRFRAYNDAAGVLLDTERRRAYDAELAEQREVEEPGAGPEATARRSADAEPPTSPGQVREDHRRDAATTAYAYEPSPDVYGSGPATPSGSRGPGLWAIGAATVAAVLAIALLVWVLAQPNVKPRAEAAKRADTADSTVQTLVSDKVVPALSYDYRHLDENLKGLQALMTSDMAAKEGKAWGELAKQAKQQHAVVVSQSPNTGLTRVTGDATKAVVVAFIDQHVQKTGTAPFVLKMWATFVLVKDKSSGDWLVDDICTDRVCG